MLFIFSLKPTAFLTKSIPVHISLTKSEYIFVTGWQIRVFIIFYVFIYFEVCLFDWFDS